MPKSRSSPLPALPPVYSRVASIAVAISLLTIAYVFDKRANNTFRVPKELLFRTAGFVAGLISVFAFTTRDSGAPLRRVPKPALVAVVLIVAWTVLTTVTSTNMLLSIDSTVTVVCSALFFLACLIGFDAQRPLTSLNIALVAALPNAILAVLQEYHVWQPFTFPPEFAGHMATTALLGNPNDVGSVLVLPAVGAAVGVGTTQGRVRAMYVVATVVLCAGIIASGTRTAIFSFIIAILVLATMLSRRGALVAALAVAGVAALALVPGTTVGNSVRDVAKAVVQRRYDIMFSERLPAFLTAIEMARDHPLVGVGPGCFKFQYMRYRVQLTREYPAKWTRGWGLNFAETHDDYLQTLAETGIPGLFLIASSIGIVLFQPRTPPPAGRSVAQASFPNQSRIPIAVAASVLMLAQFPLQIAAARAMLLFFAARVLVPPPHES